MPRSLKLYLEDVHQAIQRIKVYVSGMTLLQFSKDQRTYDAVIRNLAIIGEATKNIPSTVRENYPSIEWNKIVGLRDLLVHAYFGVDVQIIWDIIQHKLDTLQVTITEISKKLKL